MTTQSISILANMPAPSYKVQIPYGLELWYQIAAPLFLTLAISSFGLWLARSRGFRQGSHRAMLLACTGSMCLTYSAWWIWRNREAPIVDRDIASIVAFEMPFLWILFCMLAFLITRMYLHWRKPSKAEANENKPPVSYWWNEVLAVLLMVGTVIPMLLAGDHALLLPFLFLCWILALVAWGILGFVAWCIGQAMDRSV